MNIIIPRKNNDGRFKSPEIHRFIAILYKILLFFLVHSKCLVNVLIMCRAAYSFANTSQRLYAKCLQGGLHFIEFL